MIQIVLSPGTKPGVLHHIYSHSSSFIPELRNQLAGYCSLSDGVCTGDPEKLLWGEGALNEGLAKYLPIGGFHNLLK